MSDEINVISRTQVIIVDPTSDSVAVINAGPQGPGGGGGGGGNTNPIDFLGSHTSEARFREDETGDNTFSDVYLVADTGSGGIAKALLAARKFPASPAFDGGVLSLYNGDSFNGIFAHAFPNENQLLITVANSQTTSPFKISDHDGTNVLLSATPTGAVDLLEQSSPASPASNVARLYAEDVSGVTKLRYKDSGGTVTDLGGGGASFPISYDTSTVTHLIDAPGPSIGGTTYGDALAIGSQLDSDPTCFGALVTQASVTVGNADLYAAGSAHDSHIIMFGGPTHSDIYIMMDSIEVAHFKGRSGDGYIGFFGTNPVTQAVTPTTLSDVITILSDLGLCA